VSASERLKRFSSLLKVYRQREDRHAARLREAIAAMEREQRQLDGLDSLRLEYQSRFEAAAGSVASAAVLKNFRRFMTSLELLRKEQGDRTARVQAAGEARRQEWIGARQRVQGIENLDERLRTDIQEAERRHAQRALDEARRR
jgi:flagellar export protein FliJ